MVLIGAVLSDQRKRTMYDAGLYDPDEEDDEVRLYVSIYSSIKALFVC